MKRILLTSTATSALLLCGTASAELSCVEAPDCSSLGYTKTARQCSGKNHTVCPYDAEAYSCEDDVQEPTCSDLGYKDHVSWCPNHSLPCPTDTSKVKCLSIYKAGDIKYSRQTKDHDGWLKCDGRLFQKTKYPELYMLLGKEELPNYRGYYLKSHEGLSQTEMDQMGDQTLPNITGTVGYFRGDNLSAYTDKTGAFYKTETRSTSSWTGNSHTTGAKTFFDANKSHPTYGADDGFGNVNNVNPMHYRINTFIYAGRIGENCQDCVSDGISSNEFRTCYIKVENFGGINMTVKRCPPTDVLNCHLYYVIEEGGPMDVYDDHGELVYGEGGRLGETSDACYKVPECVKEYSYVTADCDGSDTELIRSCEMYSDCMHKMGIVSF